MHKVFYLKLLQRMNSLKVLIVLAVFWIILQTYSAIQRSYNLHQHLVVHLPVIRVVLSVV
ncbi:hypothetical protein C1N60_11840 [Pantoea sp. SGAir0184]